MPTTTTSLRHELDRQLEVLLANRSATAAGMTERELVDLVRPLEPLLDDLRVGDGVPFVLVVPTVPHLHAVAQLELRGKRGFTSMSAEELTGFLPLPDLGVPVASPYLLVGVDTGGDTLGVAPNDALPVLTAAGRSPLTLEEGLAVVTQLPDLLSDANCFEMLGSRGSDKRVTGLWVMKGGAPRLGWCWMGAPHSWLGAASCTGRLAVAE